jgi:uncharacterized protein (TIGR02147 family)
LPRDGLFVTLVVEMAARTAPRKVEVDIYDFLDYRAFLRAYYEAAKKTRAGFSYRLFSEQAGLKSPNFLKLVIDGERNLGPETVDKVAKALGLGSKEGQYFADLVNSSQAESAVDRSRAFERVAASRRFRSARRIDALVLSYLSHWYHPAIRELAARADFSEDPVWIAKMLVPCIRASEAKNSLSLLLELGLLTRAKNGRLTRGEVTLTTEHEVKQMGAANFHRQMMERAADSIQNIPREERDLAALTVCVSAETAAQVKQRIHAFRESLADLCDADAEPARVHQLNIQWFPLSRGEEDGAEAL